eukprot:3763058-Rhodomonas_salina.2
MAAAAALRLTVNSLVLVVTPSRVYLNWGPSEPELPTGPGRLTGRLRQGQSASVRLAVPVKLGVGVG